MAQASSNCVVAPRHYVRSRKRSSSSETKKHSCRAASRRAGRSLSADHAQLLLEPPSSFALPCSWCVFALGVFSSLFVSIWVGRIQHPFRMTFNNCVQTQTSELEFFRISGVLVQFSGSFSEYFRVVKTEILWLLLPFYTRSCTEIISRISTVSLVMSAQVSWA